MYLSYLKLSNMPAFDPSAFLSSLSISVPFPSFTYSTPYLCHVTISLNIYRLHIVCGAATARLNRYGATVLRARSRPLAWICKHTRSNLFGHAVHAPHAFMPL
jgi:hypothetical protein